MGLFFPRNSSVILAPLVFSEALYQDPVRNVCAIFVTNAYFWGTWELLSKSGTVFPQKFLSDFGSTCFQWSIVPRPSAECMCHFCNKCLFLRYMGTTHVQYLCPVVQVVGNYSDKCIGWNGNNDLHQQLYFDSVQFCPGTVSLVTTNLLVITD